MYSFNSLKNYLENTLNSKLVEVAGAEERNRNPFRIFADVGEAGKAKRENNTIYANRYGVCSVLASNVASINGLEIYDITASVDILVSVDRISSEVGSVGEYAPVIETRRILDEIAAQRSSVTVTVDVDGVYYSITPVYTVSTAGTFEVDAGELGKVVPISFSVDVYVVENGVNSSQIKLWIDGDPVNVSQIAEDMVASAEGQTRMNRDQSTFNVQESKYTLSFVTPVIKSELCEKFLELMHYGGIKYQGAIKAEIPVFSVSIQYPQSMGAYQHRMVITAVRLTGQIPNNAGLNVEMIEADPTMD